eukprot:1326460-Amphidinium_carterae.2
MRTFRSSLLLDGEWLSPCASGLGSYKPADVLGPPDFASWAACYTVYSAVLLILRYDDGKSVVKPQALVEELFPQDYPHS